ncbi:MAG: cytochrome d ubiquinol oxidase subunit II, partial [Deltaproteobacteria bacterium]|nr:cytochrome d ubiquinol oxidase subunit II [Deltaproteobacteria bacterium]
MMWMAEYYVAAVMLLALCVYLLTGGADFGSGILDLLCAGPRASKQRQLISKTLAPVWEANHVWLILIIILLFVCFPSVFSTVSIVLHIPITIMLVGITLRGAAFIFRTHDLDTTHVQRRWNLLFAIGSIITPFMLGVCLGAVASGNLPTEPYLGGSFYDYFIGPWLQRFPMMIGSLTLLLCAFLSSLYLTPRAHNEELKQDFRHRAFGFAILIALAAFITLYTAKSDAPLIYNQLLYQTWSLGFQVVMAFIAVSVFIALFLKQDLLAKLTGMAQAVCMISGWALAQFPYLIVDSHTILQSAASPSILIPVLIT